MAKAQAKKKSSPLIKWLLIGSALVIGYLVLTPPDNSSSGMTAKPAAKKAATTDQAFLPVDYDREKNPYPPLKTAVIDSFRPDIVHGSGAGDLGGAGAGWTYSGMAVVDGVGQAVLVNTSTGDTEILHRGQDWQDLKVQSIAPDYMVFNGPNGPQTIHVDTKESEKPAPATATAAVGPLPMPPASFQMPLTGDIGSGDQSISFVQDNPGGGNWRGRRGGRRGRNAGN